MSIDAVLNQARQRCIGLPEGQVAIRRRNLTLLVEEIERLRSQPLPDANTKGKAHKNANRAEKEAAWKVMPRSGTQRMTVLRAIVAAPDGLTDHELSEATGLWLYSAAPRRNELVGGGWVRDSGATRPTQFDTEATVWVATDRAIALKQRINQ